jgi:protein-disulfide isomerase
MKRIEGEIQMKKFVGLIVLTVLVLFVEPGFAQSREELKTLREEIMSLRGGQTAIQEDLKEIKSILGIKQAQPQPKVIVTEVEPEFKDKVVNIDNRPFKGDKNAKLIFIDVSDYQCSFCGQFVREVLPQIETDYINTGKIRYVFIDYPIEALHKDAFKAALAADCAGGQRKYWEMHDRLFENQNALDSENLLRYAEKIGLDMTEFRKCFDEERYSSEIRKELDEARKIGIGSVPTFLLGYIESEENVKVVKSLRGCQPYSDYKEMIEGLLSVQK